MEVRNLLTQAMLDMSGHRSGDSMPGRPNPAVVLTPPPYKQKELPKPLDTSSQASTQDDAEMVEASLEGVPTIISPIAATTRSESMTPSTDAAELQENANKALKELLAMKASIDAKRQRAVWELGMELHQNESKATKCLKESNAICSHVTQDAEALCFTTVKGAKVTYVQTIQEAKTTQACTIQEAEAVCSMAIRDTETQRASQAKLLQRQIGKIMQDLEEQVIWEESRCQSDFLSACQAALHASPAELKGMLVASYHVLLGQAPMSHPFTLLQRTSPVEEQSAPAVPPVQVPKQSTRPKRQHPSPDLVESMPLGGTTSKTTLEGPPAPNGKRSDLGTRCSSQAMQKHSAGTLTWWRRPGRNISWSIPTTSLRKAPMISRRYLSRWPQALSY